MLPLNAILRENGQSNNNRQRAANHKLSCYNNNNNNNDRDKQYDFFPAVLSSSSLALDEENLSLQELLDLDLRSYNNSATKNKLVPLENPPRYPDPDIGILYNTNYSYIPDSPRLLPSSPLLLKREVDWDQFSMELSRVRRRYENFDCGPFFRARDYESIYDEDDVMRLMISGNGEEGVGFEKELEYRELRDNTVGKWDYVLYYLFGVDRHGFFELCERREQSMVLPLRSCLQPLRYAEEDTEE